MRRIVKMEIWLRGSPMQLDYLKTLHAVSSDVSDDELLAHDLGLQLKDALEDSAEYEVGEVRVYE